MFSNKDCFLFDYSKGNTRIRIILQNFQRFNDLTFCPCLKMLQCFLNWILWSKVFGQNYSAFFFAKKATHTHFDPIHMEHIWRMCSVIYYLWLIEPLVFCAGWSLYVVWRHLDSMMPCIELDKAQVLRKIIAFRSHSSWYSWLFVIQFTRVLLV